MAMNTLAMFRQTGWAAMMVLACAGACGGSGGASEKAPVFTPVSATSDGDVHTLQLGDLKMVVDGGRGAHVTEFSLFGTSPLLTRDQSHNAYGSVYWPSPQASWCAAGGGCWPPPPEIDGQPYTGGIDGATNSLHLTSAQASLGGIAGAAIIVDKQFTPVPEHGAVDITYTLTNSSTTDPVSLAPWQLARVMTGGLTFFGAGTGDVTYALDSDPAFTVTEAAGNRWYASTPVSHDSKAFSDGAGWLAHATPDRLLLVTAAADIQPSDAATGEAEIEVFTNHDYVEIEEQGALQILAPTAAMTWTVRWKLRRVPGGTAIAPGDALATFTSSVLAE